MPRASISPEKQVHTFFDRPKVGRPEFEPQQWQRDAVMELAGIGLPNLQIGKIIGISAETLVKYFADEIELGVAQVNALYLKTFFNQIVNAKNDKLLMFYLRTRMGWIEPSKDEKVSTDASEMTDDELHRELEALSARERIATKARGLEAPVSG